jgi:hypothetical protein
VPEFPDINTVLRRKKLTPKHTPVNFLGGTGSGGWRKRLRTDDGLSVLASVKAVEGSLHQSSPHHNTFNFGEP